MIFLNKRSNPHSNPQKRSHTLSSRTEPPSPIVPPISTLGIYSVENQPVVIDAGIELSLQEFQALFSGQAVQSGGELRGVEGSL